MMLQPTSSFSEEPPFDLKGSLFTLTVLHLRQSQMDAIRSHLAQKVKQAPGFFLNAPVVIDLEALRDSSRLVDFAALTSLLRQQGMIPVAVRNGSTEMQAAAAMVGLPALSEARSAGTVKKPEKVESAPASRNKLVNQPVRSGQQIYVPEGDLIILGAVSAGAEVLADGNIHVYGPLRGRALAGVRGDTEVRIFCQSLEAELVSIAGHYWVIEQLDEDKCGKAVQIYLSEDRLVVKPLSM